MSFNFFIIVIIWYILYNRKRIVTMEDKNLKKILALCLVVIMSLFIFSGCYGANIVGSLLEKENDSNLNSNIGDDFDFDDNDDDFDFDDDDDNDDFDFDDDDNDDFDNDDDAADFNAGSDDYDRSERDTYDYWEDRMWLADSVEVSLENPSDWSGTMFVTDYKGDDDFNGIYPVWGYIDENDDGVFFELYLDDQLELNFMSFYIELTDYTFFPIAGDDSWVLEAPLTAEDEVELMPIVNNGVIYDEYQYDYNGDSFTFEYYLEMDK